MIVECPGCRSRYDVGGRPPGTRARCRCKTVFVLPEPERSAGVLQCPQCAAAVGVGDTRCGFCDAELLVRACPRCFARIFHGSEHCRHCGAKVEVPAAADAAGEATPRMCPRCRHRAPVRLEGRLVDDYLLDECTACHGIYVDVATLERLLSDRREVSAIGAAGLAWDGSGPAVAPPSRPAGPMYVKCPDCDGLMNRVNFGRISGVLVDVCRPHGTWFDADELPRIIEFVRAGGLERAAKRDLEREREQLAAERARVRAEQLAARRTGSGAVIVGGGLRRRDPAGGLLGVLRDLLLD